MQVCMSHQDGGADAQAVARQHEQQQTISAPMTTFLGRFKESVDFGVAEDMLRAFVPICRLALFTFYLVPRGYGASPPLKAT